jgi:arylsulfatase A-like enzyme
VIWLLVACSRTPKPTVALIVVDTLRRDALGSYGAGPDRSPELDAAPALVFENAWASSPWTMPSTATLFTGLPPSQHGVRSSLDDLPDDAATLAESYARRGYETCGINGNRLLRGLPGFRQGFDVWDSSQAQNGYSVTSDEIAALAQACIQDADGDPLFLYVHFYDPHDIYLDHPDLSFADRSTARVVSGMDTVQELRELEPTMTDADRAYVRALYAEEVAFTTQHVARVIEALPADSWWVVTGDHGEALGERGTWGHALGLTEEQIAVPLLVGGPGLEGTTDRPTSAMDVGRALRDGTLDQLHASPAEPVRVEIDVFPTHDGDARFPTLRQFGVIDGDTKQVLDTRAGTHTAWDLASDPLEAMPLPGTPTLTALLDEWAAAAPASAAPVDLDAEREEALRSLGYIDN